ncbi:uncharacterized protein LOC119085996 [Bradysia coprophila]|uniref:uncharacterized protein LOC119085996 n=1 Tax=Bradysia coprophila TaxID=38358 RepID=UPI00187DD7ED|nr:uncharacterized protein LOC119085996 [Bradysia coprophila]
MSQEQQSSNWSNELGYSEEEFPASIKELMTSCGFGTLEELCHINDDLIRDVENFLSTNFTSTLSREYLEKYRICTFNGSFIFYPAHRHKLLTIPIRYRQMKMEKTGNTSPAPQKKRNDTRAQPKEINSKKKLVTQIKNYIRGLKLPDESTTVASVTDFQPSNGEYIYECRFKCPFCEEVVPAKCTTSWMTQALKKHLETHDKEKVIKSGNSSNIKPKRHGTIQSKLIRSKLTKKLATTIKTIDVSIIESNVTNYKSSKQRDYLYECRFKCPFCEDISSIKCETNWITTEINKHLKLHVDGQQRSTTKMLETINKQSRVISTNSKLMPGTSAECSTKNLSFPNNIYYPPEEHHHPKQLTVFAHNVNGLRTKLNDVFLIASSCNEYDIYIFTETGLDRNISDDKIFPRQSFHVYRCDRSAEASSKESGGGVLIAVNKMFKSNLLLRGDNHGCEQLYVEVETSNKKLLLGALYIPPNTGTYELHTTIVKQISQRSGDGTTFILYGDFNLPHLTWTQSSPNSYFPTKYTNRAGTITTEICSDLGLKQINCCLNNHNRIRDLLWTNKPEECICYVCNYDFLTNESHHKALRIEIGLNCNSCENMNMEQGEHVECKPNLTHLQSFNEIFTNF